MAEEPIESNEEQQLEPENTGPPNPLQTGEKATTGEFNKPSSVTNPDLNIPEMEIHKHPHHVTHKKKWGEYLLEFLMLFFAVFMGFIAENIRENYVEEHRAKEYAQSLFNDLKQDTIMLHRTVGIKKWQNGKLDSLIILLNPADIQKHVKELYYYSCYANLPNLPFETTDITIQQLRNSGSLRYFTNIHLRNSVAHYYSASAFYLERENDITAFIPPLNLVAKIFNADQLTFMYIKNPVLDLRTVIHWPVNSVEFKLLGSYPEVLNEYSLYVQRFRRRNELPLILLHSIAQEQLELMTALQKEYDAR